MFILTESTRHSRGGRGARGAARVQGWGVAARQDWSKPVYCGPAVTEIYSCLTKKRFQQDISEILLQLSEL